MASHSILASMFRLPLNNTEDPSSMGLQTVTNTADTSATGKHAGGSGSAAIQHRWQLHRERLIRCRPICQNMAQRSDPDISGFKPDQQKTRLLERLTYGTNYNWLNLPLTFRHRQSCSVLGYKINDNSTAGIGAAYNIGLAPTGIIFISQSGRGASQLYGLADKEKFLCNKWVWKKLFNSVQSLSQFANKTYGRTAAGGDWKKVSYFCQAPREYATALGFPKLPSNAQTQPYFSE